MWAVKQWFPQWWLWQCYNNTIQIQILIQEHEGWFSVVDRTAHQERHLSLFNRIYGVTLVRNIIWLSNVQFFHLSSVCCIVCSPPRFWSPSVTEYLTSYSPRHICPGWRKEYPQQKLSGLAGMDKVKGLGTKC